MYGLSERRQMLLAIAITQADVRLECGTALPKLRFVGMYGERMIFTLAGDDPAKALPPGDNGPHD